MVYQSLLYFSAKYEIWANKYSQTGLVSTFNALCVAGGGGGCYKYIPVLQGELLLLLMKRMPNFKHLMRLVGWSKLLKISIDLELMRAKLWADLYQWEDLLFACLKDGREVYNGFCLEAILRLAFLLSKGHLFAPQGFRQNNYIWGPS